MPKYCKLVFQNRIFHEAVGEPLDSRSDDVRDVTLELRTMLQHAEAFRQTSRSVNYNNYLSIISKRGEEAVCCNFEIAHPRVSQYDWRTKKTQPSKHSEFSDINPKGNIDISPTQAARHSWFSAVWQSSAFEKPVVVVFMPLSPNESTGLEMFTDAFSNGDSHLGMLWNQRVTTVCGEVRARFCAPA